jgi:NAD(P)H dehydrogenase (quinone)
MSVKVSIIYYSSSGTIYAIAQALQAAAEGVGAEVRLRKVHELAPAEAIASNTGWQNHVTATQHVPEASPQDIVWADAVLFGTPTRYGNVSAQLKQFLDTLGPQWAQGQLADKVYSGFTSSTTAHGGQETTLTALYTTIHHFGGIVVAPGYTDPSKFVDGNPYGTSHVDAQGTNPVAEVTRQAAKVQAERVVKIAAKLSA